MAADTADRRAAQRARAAERREAQEADYQKELADAIVAYLTSPTSTPTTTTD